MHTNHLIVGVKASSRVACWWILYLAAIVAVVRGEFGDALVAVAMLVGLAAWLIAEDVAWAMVDRGSVSWRSLLRTRLIPFEDVAEVVPGVSPVFRVRLRNGRWLRGPSLEVGSRARYEFIEAIRMNLAARPDR